MEFNIIVFQFPVIFVGKSHEQQAFTRCQVPELAPAFNTGVKEEVAGVGVPVLLGGDGPYSINLSLIHISRLIHFLLLYTQGKEVPEVDCSQQQIASAINASRVQVTRVCARLQAQGLIRIRRGHIRILDPETLEQLSERREAGERE